VTIDYNEMGADRARVLESYCEKKGYEFLVGNIDVDIQFRLSEKAIGVEMKEVPDFVRSLQNGHLASQRRGCTLPLRVAVLGSPGDLLRALPDLADPSKQTTPETLVADYYAVLRGIGRLRASGVGVSFGLSPTDVEGTADMFWGWLGDGDADEIARQYNVEQIVREAYLELTGAIHLPMHKAESVTMAMLMCLPSVGPERAKRMIDAGIVPRLCTKSYLSGRAAEVTEGHLVTLVDGVGKKTAAKILAPFKGV